MFINDYLSREASLADWLSAIGTILVAVIALWPSISKVFIRYLFPNLSVRISGQGNIVISSDGKIHKIQIPLQFKNLGYSRLFIEQVGLQLIDPKNSVHDLFWRKFISDWSGSATVPISSPYRFYIESKDVEDKFIEFLTEEDIEATKGVYQIKMTITQSYSSKIKEIVVNYKYELDDNLLQQIIVNKQNALSAKKPILISIKLNKNV